MKFVNPEWEDLYNTLTNNKRLNNVLLDNGALITTYDFYDNYGLKSKENRELYVKNANEGTYKNLTDVLFNSLDFIKSESVRALISQKYLFSEIKEALGFYDDIILPNSLFQEIFYTCKYCYTESFFQNNWENFVPLFDFEKISENKRMSAFMDSIMKEFDKLDNIINNTKDFKSYKDIPFEYINYLSQLLGVEQKSFYIESDMEAQYRVLAENILDVYSVKGTYSSWELMFNFLGFLIELNEYYFDRRLLYNVENNNYELNESDNETYKYYLTTTDPRSNVLNNIATDEIVLQSDLSEPQEIMDFDDLVKEYGLMCVLGYDDCYEYTNSKNKTETLIYTGPVYKYFKTNYIRVKPKRKFSTGNFSLNQLYQLTALLNFLTPEFLKREMYIVVDIGESEEKFILNNFPNAGIYSTDFHMFDSEEAPIANNEYSSRYFANKYISNYLEYSNSDSYTVEPRKINDLGIEDTYRNSLGISNYTYTNNSGVVKNANIFLNPISEKIKFINTTKYWGSGIKDKNQTGRVFPVWRTNRNYKTDRGKMYITKEQYAPSLYLPGDYKKLTENEQNRWDNTQQVDLNGYNGNTLRKQIKEQNNYTKINWSTELPIGLFLNEETTELDIASCLYGKTLTSKELNQLKSDSSKSSFINKLNKELKTKEKFFEKKWMNVPNYTWVKTNEFLVNLLYNELGDFYLFVSTHDNIINYDYINNKILLNFDISNLYIDNDGRYKITRNGDNSSRENNNNYILRLINSEITEGSYLISYNGYDKFEVYKYMYIKNIGGTNSKIDLNKYRLSPDNRLQNVDYTLNTYSNTSIVDKDFLLSDEYTKPYGFYEETDSNGANLYFYFKKTQTTIKLDKMTSAGFFISGDSMSYKPLLQTTSFKAIMHKQFGSVVPRTIDFSTLDNDKIKSSNMLGSYYFNNVYLNDETKESGKNYIDIKKDRDPKFYQYKYSNIRKGDLIYSSSDGKLYCILENGVCGLSKNTVYFSNFVENNEIIKNNSINIKLSHSTKKEENTALFGIKEINFFGRLEEVDGDYILYEYDERYKGEHEETEENDYVLNNFDRTIEWSNLGILHQKIKRPIREETDKLFDEKNTDFEISNNILTEIFKNINNSFTRKDLINTTESKG